MPYMRYVQKCPTCFQVGIFPYVILSKNASYLLTTIRFVTLCLEVVIFNMYTPLAWLERSTWKTVLFNDPLEITATSCPIRLVTEIRACSVGARFASTVNLPVFGFG